MQLFLPQLVGLAARCRSANRRWSAIDSGAASAENVLACGSKDARSPAELSPTAEHDAPRSMS